MIPDEAVEALAIAAFVETYERDEWETVINQTKYRYLQAARAALEAAAPFIAAQAWDEGYSGGVREEQPGWTKNPYRAIVQAASGQNDNTEGVGA